MTIDKEKAHIVVSKDKADFWEILKVSSESSKATELS